MGYVKNNKNYKIGVCIFKDKIQLMSKADIFSKFTFQVIKSYSENRYKIVLKW